jgi:hypothetical protein
MSMIVIQFPDGTGREFRHPERELEAGEVVWHDGTAYRVLHVTTEDGGPPTVTVEPDSDGLGDLLGSERGSIQLIAVD